jgi:integrase
MGRVSEMSWEPERKRWVKMYRGVRYRVSCAELGVSLWTQEGSRMAANEWWRKKRIEIEAQMQTPDEQVRQFLGQLTGRKRCWALLGLNCGMTAVDIAALEKSQVDLTRGRLVRRRVKTGANPNVPTVDYLLWPETIAALRECWSEDSVLALTSEDGTPLVHHSERSTVNSIARAWTRARLPISHKAFRSISSTALTDSPYANVTEHFLAHSPKSIKDKHYAAPPAQRFDQALLWLRDKFLVAR